MPGDVVMGILWYVVRNAPTCLVMFFLVLLAVRGRLRFSFRATVGIAAGIIAASCLAAGAGVVLFAGEEGIWATVPLLAVSLASLAALTRMPWSKRLFVLFSAMGAAAIAVLAYDVLLRTVALEWSFGARRMLDAAVCSFGPLLLAPLFARTIRWGIEHIEDNALWRRLAAVPAAFFIVANALYALAYSVEFGSIWADALYALAVATLAFLLVASYVVLFSALSATMENARLREAAQLESMQHARYEDLRRMLRETAQARHDFRHQLLLIRSFADENDLEGLRAYLGEQGTRSDGGQGRYAANFAVDSVASHFAERARACGAETSFELALPERLPLPETDFCMALANLLENAAEACERAAACGAADGAARAPDASTPDAASGQGAPAGSAQTGTAIGKPGGTHGEAGALFLRAEARMAGSAVLVAVRNSCTPADAQALAAAAPGGVLAHPAKSTKRAGDGTGLASVAALAERYRGEARASCSDDTAEMRLLLRSERASPPARR